MSRPAQAQFRPLAQPLHLRQPRAPSLVNPEKFSRKKKPFASICLPSRPPHRQSKFRHPRPFIPPLPRQPRPPLRLLPRPLPLLQGPPRLHLLPLPNQPRQVPPLLLQRLLPPALRLPHAPLSLLAAVWTLWTRFWPLPPRSSPSLSSFAL